MGLGPGKLGRQPLGLGNHFFKDDRMTEGDREVLARILERLTAPDEIDVISRILDDSLDLPEPLASEHEY